MSNLKLPLMLFSVLLTASASANAPGNVGLHEENRSQSKTPVARTTAARPPTPTVEDGKLCVVIDFEGVGNQGPIPEFDGISSPDWLGIIDADAGGTGNFANEPSPETIAFWLGGATGTGSSREIQFDEPVASVEFFYVSFVNTTITAFDANGTQLDSAVGQANFGQGQGGDPTGAFDQWDPLGVSSDQNTIASITVSGAVNQTGIDDLKVCRRVGIDTVEFTQAIQQIQDLDELQADLASDRQPPVPLVAGKPAVARIYFPEELSVVPLQLSFTATGQAIQASSTVIQPKCDRSKQRKKENGCSAKDFFFTPPAGDFTATVTVRDAAGNELEETIFELHGEEAEPLTLAAVRVCDRETAPGSWQCSNNPATTLSGLVPLMRKLAPTHQVKVIDSGETVRRDTQSLMVDVNQNGTVDNREDRPWWNVALSDIGSYFSVADGLRDLLGIEDRRYYGMTRPVVPGTLLGKAQRINSRAAMSRSTVTAFGTDASQFTVAHEVFHTLGRQHTNKPNPALVNNVGCVLSKDSGTDWPYGDNRVRSGTANANTIEIGFDVSTGRPVDGNVNFEVMGYCNPAWISTFSYVKMLNEELTRSASGTANNQRAVEGNFLLVRGQIDVDAVVSQPIYTLATAGSTDNGIGTYELRVVDASGDVLFARQFVPQQSISEDIDDSSDVEPALFSELIPVQQNGAEIRLVNLVTDETLQVNTLGGANPVVSLAALPGGPLSGIETLSWSTDDADSDTHTYWVQYSANDQDLGSWVTLALDYSGTSLAIDFDQLTGADETGFLRVIASDGVNSSVAVSGPISVGFKAPNAAIFEPANDAIFKPGQTVWLQGAGRDVDDPTAQSTTLSWESDLDGLLGNGESLPVNSLSSGQHVITLTVEDADGNVATASISVIVAGAAPSLALTIEPLDTLPTTCVRATIASEAGSVPLDRVEYSLDGGETYVSRSADDLPLQFIVPGSGFFNFVARTFDIAGQMDAQNQRFFTDAPCADVNGPPVAMAGDDQTAECASADGTSVALDGSLSFDPDGDMLTCTWSSSTCTIADANACTTTATCPLGTHNVSLTVSDGQLSSAADTVTIGVADTVAPVLTCSAVDDGSGQGFELQYTATDTCGGTSASANIVDTLDAMCVTLPVGAGDFVEASCGGRCRTKVSGSRVRTSGNRLDLVVVGTDDAGNEGQCAVSLCGPAQTVLPVADQQHP